MDRPENLVFDIGIHNGDDAAYYLELNYFVVGVEANPLLAAQCAQRFEKEVKLERIKIIHAGVLKEAGEFTFYRNLRNDSLSSFRQPLSNRCAEWQQVKVPCITTQSLIEEYGKPYFMKVDIEGADIQSLYSITAATAPPYVSLELNIVDPILERLIELGYSAFKFVDGETYRTTTPIFDHEIGWRLLRKVGRVAPLVRKGIRMLPQRLRPKSEYNPTTKYSPGGYEFGSNSSGPFGEEAAGSWLTPRSARRRLQALQESYRRDAQPLWWDVHARHSSFSFGKI